MGRKFDVVIGNPPYQEEAQGDGTRDTPVYHQFMNAAYEVASKAVLITPARFLFNAGFTPKAWNEKMLADRHLSVPHYVPNSNDLFPGTDIKGGIAVTYWDEERDDEPIDTFTSYPELNQILHKVNAADDRSIAPAITSSRSFRYTDALYAEHPQARALRPDGNAALVNTNTFEQFSFLYRAIQPENGNDYVRVLGLVKNRRLTRWIRKEYITGPASFHRFKVVVPAANGSGALGEVLSNPLVAEPEVAVTQTFITIGAFEENAHARACLNYVKTKFARAMLGILKITQHNPAKVWKHVPLQNFTETSDIDWSSSILDIDHQLYAKYKLDAAEVEFIEARVKPME
ncbi:Eco57I restriction-modification methylase domain-containing protein [Curtobacterium sp. MCBD17_008]|uniref:Eco57I restriction-modification methylase domain-containing protein n=1 Tax=Curtobacterium sp. MCBD17_008 TaxID=2175656 RepID=UPI000DA90348|nr:Eco57I restriction-modification methylase domain-containing protein [Curtobacterium sp. MCBD17_008]PZE88873.1 restriction endonuclease [Curtobacterium sp. MCBD17_008]